ncbi:MAG: phosphate signaling complex protein PhoU [Chloroflexi bacterium]|jgi:phosphate transport system protein|nr:phosphate signaling complex protein PhoU [Chloroflexota bacterium]
MRVRFDEQLELLNSELIKMGGLCEEVIFKAATAMLKGDPELALEVIPIDQEIDRKEHDIENLCLKLLLQQQPVAKDLRLVSAALKMVTDMERIGDQAADIAEIVRMDNIPFDNNNPYIRDMANATVYMVNNSINAFVHRDLEMAHAVIAYDDIVDDLFNKIKVELIQKISACDITGLEDNFGEIAIDMLMVAKYFERIGDHAVNIAEWVEFAITGHLKDT